ncbi:ribonuclease III domain-containing protein [Trichophaea hybrida]|nr:ribonuclease III domain-containing protein [Trichophaea hybrida]
MSNSSKSKKRSHHDSDEPSPSKKVKSSAPAQPNILGAFESFSQSLSTLLSPSISQDALSDVLGEEKANFLLALRSMKESDDLAWLPSPSPKQTSSTTSSSSSQTWPPPLPELRNAHLRRQVFTHRSCIPGEQTDKPGTENLHYERLEFLGDAYLQSISSHILYNRFSTFREGSLSDMRQNLVSNKPLSEYARIYNMHKMIRGGKGSEGHAVKIIADCFESYIGAIALDRETPEEGLRVAMEWLTVLFEPKLREMEQQRKWVLAVDKMAKQKLYSVAGGSDGRLEYKWTDGGGGNQGGYWITVFLNGWGFKDKVLGKGWGPKKS